MCLLVSITVYVTLFCTVHACKALNGITERLLINMDITAGGTCIKQLGKCQYLSFGEQCNLCLIAHPHYTFSTTTDNLMIWMSQCSKTL